VKLFEPFAHMAWRTPGEYRSLARRGVEALIEPAACPGQPRSHAGSCEDHFSALLGWEAERASRAGVTRHCALGLGPRETDDPGLVQSVLFLLGPLLEKDGVAAVGELGFEEFTAAEDDAFLRQADLARRAGLPIIARVGPQDGCRAVERAVGLLREARLPERRALLVGLGEDSLGMALDAGVWAGLSLHPRYGLSPRRAAALALRFGPERLVLGSGADWDESDPLSLPAVERALARAGAAETLRRRLLWENPHAFYAQSGRLEAAA
jgi:predicted metal-dependent TIM-barrel fold hydrolase